MEKLVKRFSLVALLLVFGLSGMAWGQTEILVNGDFEIWADASTPTGWTKVENITQEATEVHGGTYSAKHIGGTKDLGQYVTATPGNSYTITLWCKVEAGDNSDARLWAYWKGAGSSIGSAIESPYFGATDHSDWSTYTVTLDAPATADTLYFEVRTYSGATAYWDDLSVVETAPPPDDPADYFIPKGSHAQGYVSLKAAVDSINIHGVSGEINFVLDADTLREDSFTFTADMDADSNVTVKPAPGRDVVLIVTPGLSQGNGIQMIGFDKGYVTFDGSNDGSDSRNLLVTTETNDTRVPFGANTSDADHIVLKNMIIKNLDNVTTGFRYGAVINDVAGVEAFTVDNCQIGSPEIPVWKDGVDIWGSSSGPSNGIVTNNDIYAACRGISTYVVNDCVFNNNTITMLPTTGAGVYTYNYVLGIYITGASGPTEIKGNNISFPEAATKADSYLMGLAFAGNSEGAGIPIYIENNMINMGHASEVYPVYGIGLRSANPMGNLKVYHNTVVINDIACTNPTYAIGNHSNGTGPVEVELKNNIMINNHTGNAGSSAIGILPTSSVLTSDQNILVSDQNFVNFKGTSYADLAAWQATGEDAGSVSKAVTFTAADDLHLATPSDTDLDLVMPAIAGIDMDIDGDARGTFYVYAGADEGTAYPVSNDLHIGFSDDSDLANWVKDGWESVSVNSDLTALQIKDAGWGMGVKRPINATLGSLYKLTAFIKTAAWDTGSVDISVEGLGNDQAKTSIFSEDGWTEFSVIGIAEAESGNIYFTGSYPATHNDTVWVDSLSWDDQYMDLISSPTIADARMVADGDDAACIGIVTATTIGAPLFMQDATAGIALYDSDLINDGIIEEGDEILAVGEVDNYNGLIQIKYSIDYQVLSKGNNITPITITVPDLDSRDYQSMLVMVEEVDTVAGFSWPAEGSSKSITLTDGTDEFTMRIDSDGEMDGATPPESWPLDLIGVVGEYYSPQIMPRYMEDFITNQPPANFLILNPADGAVITSFEDPEIVDMDTGTDTVKALFLNWTEAIDPEGDTLDYEMHFIGDGPEEELITQDTFLLVPLDEETPYEMNGIYTYYFTATDPMGKIAYSDTNIFTFDFPAPPRVTFADVVLIDGVPKMYAMFDIPFMAAPANFKFIDWSDGASVSNPTGMEFLGGNAILLSGALVEDHFVSLAYSGVITVGGTVTVDDTTKVIDVLIPFSDNHPEDITTIETFETNTGTFWAPTGSGSTTGLLTTSTFAVSADEAYRGLKSGKLDLKDDSAVTGGWYVRLYHTLAYTVQANSKLMIMVKGTNANVEMRISVKDTGYEQGPWKSVSVSADDWQVVSFDLLNDEAEGWITGDSVITGSTVKIEAIHMRCSEDADVVLYLDEFTERKVLSAVDVTLNVIMKQQYELGKFNLATDFVDVAGTMNGWGGTVMADFDGDTTYSVVLPLMPYSEHAFKFRINGSWDDGTCEFPSGGPNRELTVGTSSSSHTYWYNDDTLEVAIDGIPVEFALHQNYPNPFNPTTTINFDLPAAADVKLVIYDIAGRKVRTLVNGNNIEAGYKKIVWNGRDDFGNGVATGMYIYRIIAGDNVDVKKMTFLK